MTVKVRSKLRYSLNIFRKPSHWRIILRDAVGLANELHHDEVHLRACMEWLCRAQDITGCGGISGGYFLDKGWMPPYPETTGYIISTFLEYSTFSGDDSYVERAIAMGDWEIEIQLPTGAVRGGWSANDYPMVFNTGQVILGWTALYKDTGERRFLEAAIKAADWLVAVQDDDGKWSKCTYQDIPHAYHSRVAWALLKVYNLTEDRRYKNSAARNLDWVLTLIRGNGWINRMSFDIDGSPPTHTVAYTLRGILESSLHLSAELARRLQDLVLEAASRIMRTFELRKSTPYSVPDYLPGTLNEKWRSKERYSCLTGDSQIAIIWLKLYNTNGDARFLNSALKLIDQVKATQNLNSHNPGIRGGIAGSFPLWGGYMRFAYPNWPPKFFADSIMLQESVLQRLWRKQQ